MTGHGFNDLVTFFVCLFFIINFFIFLLKNTAFINGFIMDNFVAKTTR